MNTPIQPDARMLEQHLSIVEKNEMASLLLSTALNVSISLRVLELMKKGGPTDEDLDRIHVFLKDLGEHGTDLYFPGNRKGSTTDRFEQIVEAVAILSFSPGGLTVFGRHYENQREEN
jgi:hypothetical protein